MVISLRSKNNTQDVRNDGVVEIQGGPGVQPKLEGVRFVRERGVRECEEVAQRSNLVRRPLPRRKIVDEGHEAQWHGVCLSGRICDEDIDGSSCTDGKYNQMRHIANKIK